MIIEFYKYQGTGNDFIVIDDRKESFNINDSDFVKALCERKLGVGADGLILLRNHKKYDFEMIYFNRDGSQSSMCGNGGRCVVAFAHMLGVIDRETVFMAVDGKHKGRLEEGVVALEMRDVLEISSVDGGLVMDTGSPHYVKMVDSLDSVNVNERGREIRNTAPFKKEGVNVNFVQDSLGLHVRTYERGVEAETLSCGTGVVAAAIAMHYLKNIKENHVEVITKGGCLSVFFEEFNDLYRNIWLRGEVDMVYVGKFEC